MNAEQLFHDGKLDEAVVQVSHELRETPTDDRRRTFLVELLCLNGQWDRAGRILDGMQGFQGRHAAIYRQLLRAEEKRRHFLQGDGAPQILCEETARLQLAPYQEAAQALERGDDERAFALLDDAEIRRPRVAGKRAEKAFADIRDADDRFAPVLEFLSGEEYSWVPFAVLRTLRVQAPRHPFDLIFVPVLLDVGKGPTTGFVPVRYPGSEQAAQPAVRLGRQTTTVSGSGVRCLGQRILSLDDEMVPFLQLNSLHTVPAGPGS